MRMTTTRQGMQIPDGPPWCIPPHIAGKHTPALQVLFVNSFVGKGPVAGATAPGRHQLQLNKREPAIPIWHSRTTISSTAKFTLFCVFSIGRRASIFRFAVLVVN